MRSSILTVDNKIIIAGPDDQVLQDIACGNVQGWILHIQTTTNEPLNLVSLEPHRNDLQQIQYLINYIASKGTLGGPILMTKQDDLTTGKDDSSDDIPLGNLSDSNSDG